MLKKSIGIGLLCLTGQAYANVNVTTTNDIVTDDKECSLREAVHYVNQYLTAQPGEKESEKKQREEDAKKGYFGCGGEDATNTIVLEEKKEYKLNSEIAITSALTLMTEDKDFGTDDTKKGLKNATIKATGAHRLFTIDDKRSEITQIIVNLIQVNLEGCGLTNICADRGGVLFNRELLNLDYTKVSNGYANEGGAVYNEGLISGTAANSAGLLRFNNVIFEKNKAKTGAVIFMGQPLFSISKSVFRDNEVTNSNGALIYSEDAFDSGTTSTSGYFRTSVISNSNFLKNKGYLANVRDGVYVNNVTAVDNSLGFYFHAPAGQAHISNSIVAGNKVSDCAYAANDKSLSLNNLVGKDCSAGESNNLNSYLGSQKLFAGSSSENNTCDRPPADGLLCPFKTPENYFIGHFKPRLLSSYKKLSDSPIVNRGRLYSDGSNEGLASCEGVDIRGFSRTGSVHCDIGAVEVVISNESITRIGKDIKYGEIAQMTLMNSLGDGELLPATECESVLGTKTAPDGKPWQVGCLRVQQNSVTPVSKGSTVMTEHGDVTYTPHSNYHGLDDFNLVVITTTSRFSEAQKDRDIIVPVRIVQSPGGTFPNETIEISKPFEPSSGSTGLVSIISLLFLSLYRRKIKS